MIKKIDKNFYDTLKILNNMNISYCCANGTMLGLLRDGDLIPWDKDVDISIFAKPAEYSNLIKLMNTNGFIGSFHRKIRPGLPELKFHREGGRKIEFSTPVKNSKGEYCLEWYECEIPNIYKKLKLYQKLVYKFLKFIGRTPFQETQLGIKPCSHVDNKIKKIICFFLKNFFPVIHFINIWLRKLTKLDVLVGYYTKNLDPKKTRTTNYCGIDCKIPDQSEKICADLYGSDWEKPKRITHYTDFLKDSKNQKFVKEI